MADTFLDDLRTLTESLEYPSETDAPVEVFSLSQAEPKPWEGLPVTTAGAECFFTPLRETPEAASWHALYTLLASRLGQLTYLRAGEVSLDLYVFGTDPESGDLLGIRTHSVET